MKSRRVENAPIIFNIMIHIIYVTFNRRQICLGRFELLENVIQARRQAEIDYFGEYRRQE